MSTTKTLTGRVRFRAEKRLFGPTLLILEVEVGYSGTVDDSAGGRCNERDVSGTYYRDAVVQDLVFPKLELKT